MSGERSSPGGRGASAALRILRGWGTALVLLLLLGWFGAEQPFYRPATALAGVVILAVAIRWSWRASERRGDRRGRAGRRRGERRWGG